MEPKLIALVPAAGIGARAAGGLPTAGGSALPKQYRLLHDQPMLRWAVRALLADSRIQQVRVVVAPNDIWVEAALQGLKRTVWRRCGGETRAQTVQAGLLDAGLDPTDWVLVHDAARPGLPATALARLIDTCLATGQGGLLAQPVPDTVKRQASQAAGAAGVSEHADLSPAEAGRPHAAWQGHVAGVATPPCSAETLNRDGLWLAQTPQMFRAGLLLQALDAAQNDPRITDEASAMELAGHAPCLVTGSVRNFKVTWPEDFQLMERWLDV
jgi:2-C-methyl-D-erythritol 4-phosphate cytidylyltransferase